MQTFRKNDFYGQITGIFSSFYHYHEESFVLAEEIIKPYSEIVSAHKKKNLIQKVVVVEEVIKEVVVVALIKRK